MGRCNRSSHNSSTGYGSLDPVPDITDTVKRLNHGVQSPDTVGIAAHAVRSTASMWSVPSLTFRPLHPLPMNPYQFPLDTMLRGSHRRSKHVSKGITLRYFKCCDVETWSGAPRDRIIGGKPPIWSDVTAVCQKKGIQSEKISTLYGGPSDVRPPAVEGLGGP